MNEKYIMKNIKYGRRSYLQKIGIFWDGEALATEGRETHTSYLSRTPRIYSCKFFLAGVNFYRFNAKIWQFTVYFAVI